MKSTKDLIKMLNDSCNKVVETKVITENLEEEYEMKAPKVLGREHLQKFLSEVKKENQKIKIKEKFCAESFLNIAMKYMKEGYTDISVSGNHFIMLDNKGNSKVII